jgi:sugar phosphate isomerase/epimerase
MDFNPGMNRRRFIQQASFVSLSLYTNPLSTLFKDSGMGIVVHSYATRWNDKLENKNIPAFKNAIDLLEHCSKIGAGGIQTLTKGWTAEFVKKLRARKDQLGMYIEGSIAIPSGADDVARFENELKLAKEAGITILRTVCSSGRRYETYHSLEEFKMAKIKAISNLQLAEPVLRKHKIKLAIENHKDWLSGEHVEIIKKLGSEYIGITLDFGNSIALIEDPMVVVNTLAPYAFTTHVKDMAVDEYRDGFLLSEIPLGQGMLNLAEMMEVCKKHNPLIRFNLEMITRDPLEIPCLKDAYWVSFDQASAITLAHGLKMVKEHRYKAGLPRVSHLNDEEKMVVEEKNILDCLQYSITNLGLK